MDGIKKIYMEFANNEVDGLLHYQIESISGHPFSEFELPFDVNNTTLTKMKMLIYEDGKASPEIDLDMFKYIMGEDENLDTRELQKRKDSDPILKRLDKDFFVSEKYENTPSAVMHYADVTERDLLGEKPIRSSALISSAGGIWGHSGLRKLEFTVENMLGVQNVDVTISGALYWNQIDSKPIAPMFEEGRVYEDLGARVERDESTGDKRTNVFTIYCDTNRLGEQLDEQESPSPIFNGRFEVHYKYNSEDNEIKEAWGFPVSLCVQNTKKNTKLLEKKQPVSIDFGTSASCAAVRDGKISSLLTISGPEKRISAENEVKRYENPTNIMVYNWEELRRQWQAGNEGTPFLLAPGRQLLADDADYDSGYTVEEIFKNVDDLAGRKKMRAIVTDIKNVPANLEAGYEKKIFPLNDASQIVFVTDDPEKEDDTHFNPIKFYGYLLGRAINNPAKSRIYTRYLVSYPVKFKKSVKDSLRKSLAEGIMRSLPKPVREQLNPEEVVKMEYSEPVASVAALIPSQLTLDKDRNPVMFAVFDLGGGTLDTAFGILRKARGDEADEVEQVIQIFGTGGDNMSGGERLIHKLAFKIYTDNYSVMEENNIPFIKPVNVPLPAMMNEDMLEKRDEISESNVHTIIEKIARPLFCYGGTIDDLEDIFPEYEKDVVEAKDFTLPLITAANEEVNVTLNINGVDEFLEKEIGAIIDNFKNELEEKFSKNEVEIAKASLPDDVEITDDVLNNKLLSEDYSLTPVKIFLGGNASKQKFVRKIMDDNFHNQTEEIGRPANPQPGDKKEKHASQKITAKTAVAFGQLRIGNYGLDMSVIDLGVTDTGEELVPFQFNVGYFDPNTDEFVKVIEKGSISDEWKEANFLERDTDSTQLYYTEQYKADEETLKPLIEEVPVEDEKKRRVFIRVYKKDNNCLEYRLSKKGVAPDSSEEPDPSKVLRLA